MRKNLTKLQLAKAVRNRFGVPMREAERRVDAVVQELIAALRQGETIRIAGFGTFEVVTRRPRVGRNPHTGDAVPIPARQAVAFRPSPKLRRRLNPHLQVDE